MKNFLKIILVLPFFLTIFFLFGCETETETEYVTKTEYVEKEKQFAKTVVFVSEDVGESGVKLTMSTATEAAKIYYTTDGIEPTEKSILYSTPVNFTKNVTVKAVAIKNGMQNSPVAVATVSMIEKMVTVEVEREPDTTPPGKTVLTENSVVAGNGKVLLSWQNPDDEDFYGTEISFTPIVDGLIQPIVVEGEKSGNSSILINGLENEAEYIFSLIALDKNRNESEAVTINATPITPPDISDKIAPSEVSGLTVTSLSNRVKLEWNDPADSDLFGIEVSWAEVSDGSRAVSKMDEKSLFIAPGMGCIEVPFLENDMEYQFVVKTMDVSGNKSVGIVINSTPIASEPLEIELSIPKEKSNTSVTITANITNTMQDIKKVVCKKNGFKSAVKLLSDADALEMIRDKDSFSEWTLKIDATDESFNGMYTVAAIDSDGRAETAQIKIENFDFTPPDKVKLVSKEYKSDEDMINVSWTNPIDEDFDHVEITCTSDIELSPDQTTAKIVAGDKNDTELDNIFYRTYYIVSVDKLGNKSEPLKFNVCSKVFQFEKIPGVIIDGTESWKPKSNVFISERAIEIKSFYMSDHPVTRAEYKKLMKEDKWDYASAYDKDGNKLPGDAVGNNPENMISWYAAIVYCNKLSMEEGLEPCYTIDGKTDPSDWGEYVPSSDDSVWDAVICNFTSGSYRLPTEAEWEWAARGGENYTYSGGSYLDDVGWYKANTSGTREVKSKKANAYGLYDMSGNVLEWCWDWNNYNLSSATGPTGESMGQRPLRILRGGSWKSKDEDAQVNSRSCANPSYINNYFGFRLVRSVK